MTAPRKLLPCFPCPHQAACCQYGTSLTVEEATALVSEFGGHVVIRTLDEWRTAVTPGDGCIFLQENKTCRIHSENIYPALCKGFPWKGLDGGPYQGDATICPEMKEKP